MQPFFVGKQKIGQKKIKNCHCRWKRKVIYFSQWWELTAGPLNNPGLFYNGKSPVGTDTVPLPSSMHISESQQEFFRMLDEKIEKVRRSNANMQPPSGVDTAFPAPWGAQWPACCSSLCSPWFGRVWLRVSLPAPWLDSSVPKTRKVKSSQGALRESFVWWECHQSGITGRLSQMFRVYMLDKGEEQRGILPHWIFHLISVGDSWNLNAGSSWDTPGISCWISSNLPWLQGMVWL